MTNKWDVVRGFRRLGLQLYAIFLVIMYIAIPIIAARVSFPIISDLANDEPLLAYPATFLISILILLVSVAVIFWLAGRLVGPFQAKRIKTFLHNCIENGDWQTTRKFIVFGQLGEPDIRDVGGRLSPTQWPSDMLGVFFAKNILVAEQFHRSHYVFKEQTMLTGNESEPEKVEIDPLSKIYTPLSSGHRASGRFASKMEPIKLEVENEERNKKLDDIALDFQKKLERMKKEKKEAVSVINQRTAVISELPKFILSELQRELTKRAKSGGSLPVWWDVSSKFKGIYRYLRTLEMDGYIDERVYLLHDKQGEFGKKLEASWFMTKWEGADGKTELLVLLNELELCLSFSFATNERTPEKSYGLFIQVSDAPKAKKQKSRVLFNTGLFKQKNNDKPVFETLD